jgi:hypothetical protein
MNFYEEILKLPYSADDIFELLNKLLKYDMIKNVVLEEVNEENKSFVMTFKKKRVKSNINIEIKKVNKGFTEVKVRSEHKKIFVYFATVEVINYKNVKMLIDIILKELSICKKTLETDDFEFKIAETENLKKDIMKTHIILALIFFMLLIPLILYFIINQENYNSNSNSLTFISIIAVFIYMLIFIFIGMSRCKNLDKYKVRRTQQIKKILYNLIIDKNSNSSNTGDKIILNNIENEIIDGSESYLNKGVNYIKKIKTEKPKAFLLSVIIGSVFLVWALWSIFSGDIFMIGKDPCDINYEATGLSIDHVDWCRTDWHGNATEKLPYGLDNNDFIWCSFWNDGNWIGDGPVYIECAKELGWDGTNGE